MIELVVGMLLATIVVAAAMYALTMMFGGASEQAVDRKATARAADVMDRFQRDVAGAESPDRLNAPITRDEMRAIVLWGISKGTNGTVSAITASNPCATASERQKDYCVYSDLTVATATQLWFRSDVDATNAGHECVSWTVEPNGGLRRQVTADHRLCWPTSGRGAVLSNEVVLQPPVAAAANAQGRSVTFSYLARYNPASSGPARYNSIVDPTDCASQVVPNATGLVRGFVTNATIDLASWATGGNATGQQATGAQQRLTSSATISARANDDFAYATGCGQ